MSETLEERIRNVAKEDFALGTITAYASDFIEILNERDDLIRRLSTLSQNIIDSGCLEIVEFEEGVSLDEICGFVKETIRKYGRFEDGSS